MSWPTVPLGECARIVSGATPKTSVAEYWDGDVNWTTPKDIANLSDKFLTDTPRKITEAGLKSCSAEVLPAGSVLLSSRAPIGHVAINSVPTATNQGFKSLIPSKIVHPEYLFWWLRANRSYLESLGNGATFKEISKAVVQRIEIPLPPLEEQKRIAAILDQADALRRTRQRSIERLSALCQSIFYEMFGDRIDHGQKIRLGDVTSKIGSGATPRGGESSYKDAGTPLIRSMNIRDGHFAKKGLAYLDEKQAASLDNVTVEKADVLLNITGASVARVCLVPDSLIPARVNQHVSIIRVTQDVLPEFLEAYLLFPQSKRKLLQIAEAGATRQAITKAQIADFEIPNLPLGEQETFVKLREHAKRLSFRAENHFDNLESLFASLQQRAFRGEL